MTCPTCQSSSVIKNGRIHNGKPKWRCKACGRQFVQAPTQQRISAETKALIDRVLLERLSLVGIARVAAVSERWLQSYVNEKYAAVPCEVRIRAKKAAV
ncbi:MAG: hypothetical protein KatS3mg057_3179 [Herpetosiphonaceae bacterium]|nr:MAG: hypothetical protein KatS3mg057_3179 [Herpetosiphonaceae bacterium]